MFFNIFLKTKITHWRLTWSTGHHRGPSNHERLKLQDIPRWDLQRVHPSLRMNTNHGFQPTIILNKGKIISHFSYDFFSFISICRKTALFCGGIKLPKKKWPQNIGHQPPWFLAMIPKSTHILHAKKEKKKKKICICVWYAVQSF